MADLDSDERRYKILIDQTTKIRNLLLLEPEKFALTNLSTTNFKNLLSPHFRLFTAVSKEKDRYLPIFPDFDPFVHTLSDSPLSCSKHLGGKWDSYNSQAICHIARCNFRCRYCYVDYSFLGGVGQEFLTAEAVVAEFLSIRQQMEDKSQASRLNVLRISGGEPLFVPDFILGVLNRIHDAGLSKEVMVKCETNLSTFMPVNSTTLVEKWTDLSPLGDFNNFIVHATIHGIDGESLARNTGIDSSFFNYIMNGLEILIKYKLDIYPSIGLNTNEINRLDPFFKSLMKINYMLPLRLSIRPFRFNYENVIARKSKPLKINHDRILARWDTLLRNQYGIGYLENPRCEIDLE